MAPGRFGHPLRRTGRPWLQAWFASALALIVAPPNVQGQEPANSPTPATPIHVFLNGPTDLSTFWKSLTKPDFVILRGDEYEKLIAAPSSKSGSGLGPPGPWIFAVDSVSVSGSVENDLANLKVEMGVSLAVEGPIWASIRLDSSSLIRATEKGRDLPLRVEPAGAGRQVELSGRGRHSVKLDALVPVRLTNDGKRFDLIVPEAATTRLDINVLKKVSEASAGPGEPLEQVFEKATGRSRLRGELPPRGKLSVSWKLAEESGTPLPPLLVAQGEIALDIDPGALRTRSSWSIRSLRGTAKSLEWRLDSEDEVLELELDGQVPSTGVEKNAGFTRITIPLTDPIGPNQERRLIMTTRRSLPTGSASRFTFRGFTLSNAREQSGAIGVATSGNLWVSGLPGQGIRRIDPRSELPADLRARPATALAYRFSEQPFELPLRVEPSPPLVLAEGRTTVVLGLKAARVETRFDFQTPRGRLFDLTIGLPPGLEVESVGPEDVVSAWQTGQSPTSFVPGALPPGLRLLTLRLGPKVQEGGKYAVRLTGRQPVDLKNEDVSIALFQPIGTVQGGGRVAVQADPSLTAELSDRSSSASAFRPAMLAPPIDWPWPPGQAAPVGPPLLWLRHDETPTDLPLRVVSHPRTLAATTTLHVHLDRDEADVRQQTDFNVQFGTVDHIDLAVPEMLAGRWDVDGPGVSQRIDLGKTASGERLIRLKLTTELLRSIKLRFRYSVPIGTSTKAVVDIPWLRVEATTHEAPIRAMIVAGSGVKVSALKEGWETFHGGEASEEEASALHLMASSHETEAGPPALTLTVTAMELAPLPRTVASRLLLRTFLGAGGESRTSARYWVESHDGSLSVVLPEGGELLRAKVGGEVVREVESLANANGLRIPFPESFSEISAFVELDYSIAAKYVASTWTPPRLTEGGVVQQCYWEANVPWGRAVLGVPSDWTDENEWYWAGYVWKRRPRLIPSALASWVAGPDSGEPALPAGTEIDPRGDMHGYLFGRPGDPMALGLMVASRAGLVAICSGAVLAVGTFLILVWSPPVRLVGVAILTTILIVAAVLPPSVAFLAAQSGIIGLLLTAMLALMQLLVDRRRAPGGPVYAENGGRGSALGVGSTLSHTTPGSDDSTAIRARPTATTGMSSSTHDYSPLSPSETPISEALTARPASRAERFGRSDL